MTSPHPSPLGENPPTPLVGSAGALPVEAVLLGDAALPGDGAQIISVGRAGVVSGQSRRIVSAAALIMLGQLLSSVLGMARIEIINILFYGAASGAFIIALRPVQQVTDLLAMGAVSGALIPTFVDYASPTRRHELKRIYSSLATLVTILMALAALALFALAPWLASVYLTHATPAERQLTAMFIRITAFGLLGLGLYTIGAALLYALNEVVYPAFATFIQHVGVIGVGMVALVGAGGLAMTHGNLTSAADMTGAVGLAVGFVIGAAGEAALIIPGLRRVRVSWRPSLDLRHPALRQIARLYAPIVVGLLLSLAQQNVELILNGQAPGDPSRNITALQSATTLVQFPVGLVAAALTLAVLPALTTAANAGDNAAFKRTLALGFRLGLLLMIPAMVGLITLRTPIVALLFEHGACTNHCTDMNGFALQNYAYQLPFLALDQLLIAAFYARKNTITPVVVGILSIGLWALVAVPLTPRIGMPALAFASSALNSAHALILFALLTLTLGDLGLRSLWDGLWRIALASAAMGGLIWALLLALPRLAPGVFSLATLPGEALTVAAVGLPAILLYAALIAALGMPEARMLADGVRAWLARRRG